MIGGPRKVAPWVKPKGRPGRPEGDRIRRKPVIRQDAHIRQAAPSVNDGQKILRRGYSFTDGFDRVRGQLDAGLFFICFQRDPRKQFVPIQERLGKLDGLMEYIVPTAAACSPSPGSVNRTASSAGDSSASPTARPGK